MAAQWIEDLLSGGLPKVLDFGDTAPGADENQDGNQTRPEQNPPADYTGRDTANPNFLASISQNQLLTVAIYAGGAFLLYKLVKSI